MAGHPAVFFIRPLEHREVDNPESLPAFGEEAGLLAELAAADLQTESAERIPDDLLLVRAEENDVAIIRAGAFNHGIQELVGEVLHDRALETFAALRLFVHLDVGKTLGAVDLDELGVGVNLGTGQLAALRHVHGDNLAVRHGCGIGEHLEARVLAEVRDFLELKGDTEVRLVGAVLRHRVIPAHNRVRIREFNAEHFLKHTADHLFEHVADFFLREEGGFNIDLSEFRLTVSTEVFVAEALDDLIVTVETGDHQHLLEELGRLRQSVEAAFFNAGRHEVVAGAFRGAAGQSRGFNIDEAMLVEEAAEGHSGLVAEAQITLHHRTAQVEHAVGQAGRFRDVVVIQAERRRQRRVQHFQILAENLNGTGDQVVILGAFRTGANEANHLEAVFITDLVGSIEHFRTVRVADDLNEAFAVAKVNKNHTTVVTTAMNPAIKGDGLPDEFFINQTRINGTHRSSGSLTIAVCKTAEQNCAALCAGFRREPGAQAATQKRIL